MIEVFCYSEYVLIFLHDVKLVRLKILILCMSYKDLKRMRVKGWELYPKLFNYFVFNINQEGSRKGEGESKGM